jgi:hypothetical protein
MKKTVLPLVVVIAIISIIGNVFAYYRYSSSRPVVTVDGQAITRKQLQDRLDFLYTRQVLTAMIWQKIVVDAAQKANCVPTDSDIQNAMDQLNRANPAIIEAAKRKDGTLSLFKQDLKANLAIRNLRMAGITASSADVQAFYKAHGVMFKLPEQTQTTLVLANNAEDAGTAQRLLQNGVSTAIISQQQGLGVVGLNVRLVRPLPNSIGRAVLAMKPGDVKIIPAGKQFAIVKAKSVSSEGVPPLNSIYDQVKTAYILSKAPSETDELKQLLGNAPLVANEAKYASAIPEKTTNSAQNGANP